MDGMEPLARTESEEWSIVDDLYSQLRRFAAVSAPFDMDPDDLLQEALVNVLNKKRLTDLDYPGAYLRRTILNVAASHSRRKETQRRAMRRHTASVEAASAAAYPSDLADLYRLPPRERATLYLHEVEGYHFDEIARMLGCTEAAAKKGASRARRRLAEALNAEGKV